MSSYGWSGKDAHKNTEETYKVQKETPHATDAWYSEIKDYNYKTPGFKKGTGHFTQVIWKECTHVGFGVSGIYCVARYMPPGNMKGAFEKNVLPLIR